MKNGKKHNINAPASLWNNGNIEWFLNGQRHCEIGPALIHPGRKVEWYLFDVMYTEEVFNHIIIKLNLYRKLNNNFGEKPIVKKMKI